MPRFDFQCNHCGLLFEKIVTAKDKTIPCLQCQEESQRVLPDIGFSFASGKTVGNTGVDSLDSSIDKTVGRDADQRWEMVKSRDHTKREVQRDNGGVKKVPLHKNPETGEYGAMGAEELHKFQTAHKEYSKIYDEHKKDRESRGESKFLSNDPYKNYRMKKSKE